MENREIDNVGDFFVNKKKDLTLEDKWDKLFESWIAKVEKENMMLNLFELKLWLESAEYFFSSEYLDSIIFKYQTPNMRNYTFYMSLFVKIANKILRQLKELDFKKDKHLLNFEEFIVDKILEKAGLSSYPSLTDLNRPESWFYSFRIFLQNIKTLSNELLKNDSTSNRSFDSLKKLYHRELLSSSILISLLNGKFIPQLDKIFQKDIANIISSIKDKDLKKYIGILYILSFRTLKINNFIELNIKKSRDTSIVIPLILSLKRNVDYIDKFYQSKLKRLFNKNKIYSSEADNIENIFNSFILEYKKIFDKEFMLYFEKDDEKTNRRTLLINIVNISYMAIRELIENISKLFQPNFEGSNIFENYLSRKSRADNIKKKLVNLHTKINDYLTGKGPITPSDIFFELNLFIETDLNFLLYKDWNEFLNHYNNLQKSDFTPEFKHNLNAFHSFITKILKELVNRKN